MEELNFAAALKLTPEIGFVRRITQSIIWVEGLPGATLREMVILESGQKGEVTGLNANDCEVLLFSKDSVLVGTRVARVGKRMQVAVGTALLGSTVNSLGEIISAKSATKGKGESELREIDVVATGIATRAKITKSLETGVIVLDTLIPLGRGQRELILGDRKTGKSYVMLRSIVTQAKLGTLWIYVAIGKKTSEIRRIEEYFKSAGVSESGVVVASGSQNSVGEIFLTPYTGMAIAEYFRDAGKDVLIILDDMTTHAKFYREISLLSRKFPGRDSYPGDIFYTHSRLLERAGNFVTKAGEVSITCLPAAETAQGDFTGYVQTNLMSMTDGHIYFDADLYASGRRPAINPFISVTRVGYQTMSKLRRAVSRVTTDLLNDYEKAQSFVRFGAELGDATRQTLATGEKVLHFFNQPLGVVVPINVQLVGWGLLWMGAWDGTNIAGLVTAYTSDPAFRTEVNNLIVNSDSVETLVANLRPVSEKFLKLCSPKSS